MSSRPLVRAASAAPGSPTMPLSDVAHGAVAVVQEVGGGRAMMQRMLMLGIRRGAPLRLLHGPGARGAVVGVGGARIALGRDVVELIRVQLATAAQGEAAAGSAQALEALR